MTRIKILNITVLLMVLIRILLSFSMTYAYLSTNMKVIVSQGVILLPPIIYVLITRQNLFKLIRFNKIGFLTVFLTAIFTYCIMPLLKLINAISMLFANNFIKDTAIDVVGDNILVGLIMIAFIPSVVEEITYRGVLYNTYKESRPLKGIIVSALLFGAMHMNFNQFIYAAILGIVMALMIEATNSIIPTMIMHFIFNGSSAVLIYFLPKIEKIKNSLGEKEVSDALSTASNPEQLIESIRLLTPYALFMALIAFGLFILIANVNGRLGYIKSIFKCKNKEENILHSKENRVVDVFLILTIIICFAFSLWIEMRS